MIIEGIKLLIQIIGYALKAQGSNQKIFEGEIFGRGPKNFPIRI